MKVDGGSFRDPQSRVFYDGTRVFRGLSKEAADIDERVRRTGLADRLVEGGLLVENWRTADVVAPEDVPAAAVVESRRLPIISYPGEWSFPMLRDAALTTLDTSLNALKDGFILKDASAFNIAFVGARPILLDVSSLDLLKNHPVWTGYGQFVDHFLTPLMLEAYTSMPFQPMLRTSIEGFPVAHLDELLRGRSRFRKGVMTHVRLRSGLERRAESMSTDDRSEVANVVLPASAVQSSIRKMRELVEQLETPNVGQWEGYEQAMPYSDSESEAKRVFVQRTIARNSHHEVALDVGANEGMFTKILADRFDAVVAIDVDPGVSGALYRNVSLSEVNSATPLVVDIANPTPSFGFMGAERPGFTQRIRPQLSLWLAVIHHLCIGQGIPLSKIVDLLAATSADSIVEFVDPEDPMVRRISASRPESLDEYGRDTFETLLRQHFDIVEVECVSQTRTLYSLTRLNL